MPMFFLHVDDNDVFAEDPDGAEFPDAAAARAAAVAGGREILAERVILGKPLDGLQIIVCDAEGQTLSRTGFSDFVNHKCVSPLAGR